jgi:hypothetical protein
MDDLIQRQAAIKAIEERAKKIKNGDTLNGLAGAVGILFELPSAEPYKDMTNGEVIMAVKGEAKVIDNKGYKLITFTDDWWNSPYEPQEREG